MSTHSWRRSDGYTIRTDPEAIDLDVLHKYLAFESYWCRDVPRDVVERSVENSLCFSLLTDTGDFVGFARVVTDYATFSYLADVYVDKRHRGRELGKWLVERVMDHPRLQGIRSWTLFTRDAHGLYTQFGWSHLDDPRRLMVKKTSAKELYGGSSS